MRLVKIGHLVIGAMLFSYAWHEMQQDREAFESDTMMIRIAEIEVYSEYIDEYVNILKEEASASVRLEPGVISIFPMYQKENPTEIRIIEIYATREAYELHLKTPHFEHYKTTTPNMIKSLKLVDMEAIDKEAMAQIFKKLGP